MRALQPRGPVNRAMEPKCTPAGDFGKQSRSSGDPARYFFYIKKCHEQTRTLFAVRRACWYAAQRVLCACPALSRGGARARPVSRGIESQTPACVAPVARAGAGRDLTRWQLHAGAHMQSTSACTLDGSQAANTQKRTHAHTHARTHARTPSHLSTRLLTYSLSHTSHTLSHAHAALRQDGGNGRTDPPRLPGSHPWRCSGFVQVCARVCAPPHARVSATPRCVSALWRVSVCGCVCCTACHAHERTLAHAHASVMVLTENVCAQTHAMMNKISNPTPDGVFLISACLDRSAPKP